METKTPAQCLVDGFTSANIGYGDHISHNDIEAWLPFDPPFAVEGESVADFKARIENYQFRKLSAFEEFRDTILTERFMYLQSVRGSGYRVVKPEEQTDIALEKGFKQIQQGLRHAQKGVENVNRVLLSASEKERNISVAAKMAGLKAMIFKEREYLPKKKT